MKEDDNNWPGPDRVGRQELEIVMGNEHISFTTSKIGSLMDVQTSNDPEGLRIFYYLIQADLTVMWKLVEKLFMPKRSKAPAAEKKPTEGLKWSFASGTNLLPNFGAKIERESKLRLNDFAQELRSFNLVDMSGRNFGDEGLFFLAESLAYNQMQGPLMY